MSNYDKVFQTNSNAILGGTWGQGAATHSKSVMTGSERASSRSRQQSVSSSNFGSSNTCDAGDDDDDDDEEDDDYAPVAMSSWGTQEQQQQQQTSTQSGWDTLVDPNFKVKDGGLGSGQLHRQGYNYKPLSESVILNQRLSRPVPGSGKKTKSSTVFAAGDGDMGAVKKKKKKKKRQRVISMPVHALPKMTVNGWGSGQLTSAPFWEQPHQQQEQQTEEQNHYQNAQQYQSEQQDQPQQQEQADQRDAIEAMPLLKIEVELAPGVHIPIIISKGDRMYSLVEDICRHHQLNMTEESKEALGSTLDLLIQAKYP